MWRCLVFGVIVTSIGFASTGSAMTEKRVALVIGNSAYQHASELTNPRNDASDMAAALKGLGVEVIEGSDLDKTNLEQKIRDFSTALQGADVGVFFYAGHGLQVNGNNYIVPVDAELSTVAALEFEMVRLDVVQRLMENAAKTNILFLDACRNNPLSRNLARAMGTRSADIGRGLAPAESGVGTLISYSTQPGNVALDGTGRNSPYAGPLVKAIATPGEDILSILTGVRNEVLAATGDQQVPWENHALRARFYFNPAKPAENSPATSATIPPLQSEAARAWSLVQGSSDIPTLREFRRVYGKASAYYDQLALARMADINVSARAMDEQARVQAEKRARLREGVIFTKHRRLEGGDLDHLEDYTPADECLDICISRETCNGFSFVAKDLTPTYQYIPVPDSDGKYWGNRPKHSHDACTFFTGTLTTTKDSDTDAYIVRK